VTSPITGLGASIQRQSTTEQATDVVRQAILSGRLLPGMPLREAALAAELGTSRSTLREAARTLESEGLVRYQMNRGLVVADITGPDVAGIYAARAALEQRLALALSVRSHRELGRTADDHRRLLDALHGSPEQARAELTAHLQVGAAELQRLLDLLAQRKELAHREEREAPRG